MVNNGTVNYDHDRDGTHSEVEGCSVRNLDAIISLSNLCHYALRAGYVLRNLRLYISCK